MSTTEAPKGSVLDAFLKAYTKLTIIRGALKEDPRLADVSHKFEADRRIHQMLELGDQTVKSTPYDFDMTAMSYMGNLTDEELETCANDVRLPFPHCWFSIPIPDVAWGIMLRDEREKVIITFIMYHGDVEQFSPVSYLNRSARSKLMALKNGSHFTIYPDVEYDKKAMRVDFPRPPFIYSENPDFIPAFETENATNALHQSTNEMSNVFRQWTATAILFAGLVVRKSQFAPLIVGPISSPNRIMDALQLGKGRVPKRKTNTVRVDLGKLKQTSEPNPNSPATKIMKERHWAEAFSYLKPSLGRVVDVPAHERYKASSPIPAKRKPRRVRAPGGPEDTVR